MLVPWQIPVNPVEWLFIDPLEKDSRGVHQHTHTHSDLCEVCILQGSYLTTQYTVVLCVMGPTLCIDAALRG